MVEKVTSADFQQKVIESTEPVLVDFFATWCGPCRMMGPTIEEIAQEKQGSAKVYQLDIDESPDIAQRFSVMSVPTFIVFEGGKVKTQTIGAQPKGNILALFN
ncbi:MAG: thioredoxin [Eggerthellaceae bacterium]|jgi:thioredoxin 1